MKHFWIFFIPYIFFSCATIHTPRYNVDFTKLEQSAPAQKKHTPKNAGASGYKIKEKASSAVRIVQVSDFHSGSFGKNQKKLVSKIKAASPDFIVLTGDIFDFEQRKDKPEKNVRQLLAGIKGECPVFYVSGNHEYHMHHQNELSYVLEEYDVRYLKDEAVKLYVDDNAVIIAGVQDPYAFMTFEQKISGIHNKQKIAAQIAEAANKVEALLSEAENAEEKILFTVLLAHRPEYIREYIKHESFDLILSGHAHGGQWRFWPFPNGWYAPGQGIHPNFAGGRFNFYSDEGKPTVFIVSRGLSNSHVSAPRIFNGFELVVIDVNYNH